MDNQFLTDIQRSGRVDLNPSSNLDKEPEEKPTPSSSEENQNEAEKSPSSQGEARSEARSGDTRKAIEDQTNTENENNLPFHKHPRWIAMQTELSQAREALDAALPLLQRLGQKPDGQTEENSQIPDWFVELFGENELAWSKYRAYDLNQRKQLRSEILQEFEQEQQSIVKEQQKQEKWVDDELQNLIDDGYKFDKNELLKTALDYLPTDENGNISFKKAYEIIELKKAGVITDKAKTSNEKKRIADATMGKKSGTEEKRDYKTSADFRGKTFSDLIPRQQ